MGDLAERIEEAMDDYYFHPRVSWALWPRASEYVEARLQGRVSPPEPPLSRHSQVSSA